MAKIGAEGVIAIGCEDGRGARGQGRSTARCARSTPPPCGRPASCSALPVGAGRWRRCAAPEVRNSRDEVVGRLLVAASS